MIQNLDCSLIRFDSLNVCNWMCRQGFLQTRSQIIICSNYRISGTFDGDFNLADLS